MFYLVTGSDSGTGILVRRRQPSVLSERLRHKRCCPRTRGQRGSARGKSKSEFQKVAAFHDIFLSVRASDAKGVSPRRDERWLNRGTIYRRNNSEPIRRTRGPCAGKFQLEDGELTRTTSTLVVGPRRSL